jgi:hypothetical protein
MTVILAAEGMAAVALRAGRMKKFNLFISPICDGGVPRRGEQPSL